MLFPLDLKIPLCGRNARKGGFFLLSFAGNLFKVAFVHSLVNLELPKIHFGALFFLVPEFSLSQASL